MSDSLNVTNLHRALRDESKHKILEILSTISPEVFKTPDQKGKTVLHLIFANEKLTEKEVIELLAVFLDRGADVNAEDRRGKTALYRAVKRRMKGAVDLLLKRKADINKWSRDSFRNRTCLQMAIECEKDMTDIIDMLVDHRMKYMKKNLATDMFFELWETCSCWDDLKTEYFLKILHDLIAKGADVNGKDNQETALACAAVRGGNDREVNFLNHRGSRFGVSNEDGPNVYHVLARLKFLNNEPTDNESSNALFDLVVRTGCRGVNARNSAGKTPLHCAADDKNFAIACKLIERCANVNCQDKDGSTPLHCAVRQRAIEKLDELKARRGVHVNYKVEEKHSPSHYEEIQYRSSNSEKLVELLLERGANVNSKDNLGCRPLAYAVDVPNANKLVPMLLKRGAYVDAHKETDLPFRKVIERDNFQLAREMLAYGADVNDVAVVGSINSKMSGRNSEDNFNGDCRFVMQHWMRLRAAKLPYSREYKVPENPQVHQDCKKEIELMKVTFIDNRITIYDFLHMDLCRRRRHMKDKNLNEKLKQLVQSPELETQFPNYSVVILASYNETDTRKSLWKPAKQAWIQLTSHITSQLTNRAKIKFMECMELFFAHLRNEDLVRMIELNEVV